jgi:concanavalin A-like lectin/glucanase superfamily protein
MNRKVFLSCCVAVAMFVSPGISRAATIVAHWTFDTPSLTTDGSGNILTAADTTANHNATTQLGGTGPNITSVSGVFGQAASFSNANANGQAQTNFAWMSFPQLTEIAGASAGDFSVAAWVNVPPEVTNWDDNPILVDWGNAPANTHRFTYWFQLDNVDSNLGLRPRAQIRAANSPPDATNIDIIATTLSAGQAGTGGGATNFDDSNWHHLAWTWTKSAGQMRFYTDGGLRATITSTQTGSNLDLLVSDSPVGALGAKRDNNRYFRGSMDEVYVFTGALTDQEVLALVPEPNSILLLVWAIGGLLINRRPFVRRG